MDKKFDEFVEHKGVGIDHQGGYSTVWLKEGCGWVIVLNGRVL